MFQILRQTSPCGDELRSRMPYSCHGNGCPDDHLRENETIAIQAVQGP